MARRAVADVEKMLLSAPPEKLRTLKIRVNWMALAIELAKLLLAHVAGGIREIAAEPDAFPSYDVQPLRKMGFVVPARPRRGKRARFVDLADIPGRTRRKAARKVKR